MVGPTIDRGARRRAAIRRVLGRPGSLRRAIALSMVILGVATVLFVQAGLLGKIGIFLVTAVLVSTVFRARVMFVGDEDELSAEIRRESKVRAQLAEEPGPSIHVSDEEWARGEEALRLRESLELQGAPPPPFLEEEESAAGPDADSGLPG